jgi:hypothetical protein
MTRSLRFVRGVDGTIAPLLIHGQVCAVYIQDVPLDYSDEEAEFIVRVVDEAISLGGVHTWSDVVGSGIAAGVLEEREVPA